MVKDWSARKRPERAALNGRFIRLEPLDPERHGPDLFFSTHAGSDAVRFRYLFDGPMDRAAHARWMEQNAQSIDPLFFAAFPPETGKAEGRAALMRIEPSHGTIEIGHILWSIALSSTPGATEALFLLTRYAFDDLGYRRLEWKCDSRNHASREAALRLGFTFEGIFRQHMIVKGENRDTAWFAMLDRDWPGMKAGFVAWLDPSNFDSAGKQKRRLADCRT
jgi:RimJ/RimL family protein N-acetyltransferase